MLANVDRIQLTNPDADATARRWQALLDAERVGEDFVDVLAARRVTLQIGDAFIEILEPTGTGPARRHLASGRGGPFAVGVTCHEPERLAAHLASLGTEGIPIGEQRLYTAGALGIAGLDVLVSPPHSHQPCGLVDTLYEATHLTGDADASIAIAHAFSLDADAFVPIESTTYGYRGVLTLFDDARLDRIETITPHDGSKTMGRWFARFGAGLYMCYAEVMELRPLRERLNELAPGDWTGSDADDDGLFVHPKALGGVMMGVSRTSHAWTWSGHPERRMAPGA
jgi:hypothetical protein